MLDKSYINDSIKKTNRTFLTDKKGDQLSNEIHYTVTSVSNAVSLVFIDISIFVTYYHAP